MSDDLKQRVEQFQTLSLPGQPMGMHMGTLHLVNDLWRALAQARALVEGAREALRPFGSGISVYNGMPDDALAYARVGALRAAAKALSSLSPHVRTPDV
ncbi:hypothetical protein [Bradyrhizobium sp. Arg816]|uniref:hypothetical protein n=1 Tax=Bradyrhizobium sp. Arg816 TaxID=2998491 RepID=UPI00249EFB63|nr:hypothetical protein [Bradyrhizobium sp. Arg816]MDI3563520.1 hypothetical protein [Bradyrhizobium sp. Arg816]